MPRAAKVLLALVAVLLVLGAAAGVVFWKRPLATLAWIGRRRLRASGFEKHVRPSAAGPQVVFSGGGGAPVVLVHGAGDQAGGWSKVAPRLARSFSVVAVDLAGHGESAPERGPLPFATLLAGFDGAMGTLPQGKVTLVGNSLGAWIATVWATRHPDRVSHLVLVNGGPLLGDRPDLTLQPKTRAEADRTLAALRDPSAPLVPDFVVDDVIREAATGPIARIAAEAKGMSAYLLDGKLSGLDVPVDLLWGASDKLLSVDYAKRLAGQLPAARLTTIERCGHVPAVECPDRFTEALLKILKDPLPEPTVSSPPVAAPAAAAAPKP
ncbi:MAG TPA: alpha/beta hydrolase [Thermoanaerobaculia bacterium]|nr:alpha/beta hydrolase [Thermoanaerobaculia bacterium]